MRLATFNILHGRSLGDGLVDLDRLQAACRSLDADVIGLQEVDRAQPRSGSVDQAAAVAEAVGAVDWRFEPALVGVPGERWRAARDDDSVSSDEPAYGIALLSRLPVRRWQTVRLPALRVRAPVRVPGRRRLLWVRDEPRVGLAAEVEVTVGGRPEPLLLATTHLTFVPAWNAWQLRRLTSALRRPGLPCVLLGDLNIPGPLPRWAAGWHSLVAAKTFPAAEPHMQIDHALGHGDVPPVLGGGAVELPLSDHRALVVELAADLAVDRADD